MLLIAASGSSFDRSGCVIVCDPTACPSAAIRRTSSGHASARRPTQKKVAFSPAAASTSSICGVNRGSGPSSKVSRIGVAYRATKSTITGHDSSSAASRIRFSR